MWFKYYIKMHIETYIKIRSQKSKARSFTFIELMVVVAIIGILAGLVLGGAGAVRQREARVQAKAEVAAIEAGLTRYQTDFGSYPIASQITSAGANYPADPRPRGKQVQGRNFSLICGARQSIQSLPQARNSF